MNYTNWDNLPLSEIFKKSKEYKERNRVLKEKANKAPEVEIIKSKRSYGEKKKFVSPQNLTVYNNIKSVANLKKLIEVAKTWEKTRKEFNEKYKLPTSTGRQIFLLPDVILNRMSLIEELLKKENE
jgi:hypothetical protein